MPSATVAAENPVKAARPHGAPTRLSTTATRIQVALAIAVDRCVNTCDSIFGSLPSRCITRPTSRHG